MVPAMRTERGISSEPTFSTACGCFAAVKEQRTLMAGKLILLPPMRHRSASDSQRPNHLAVDKSKHWRSLRNGTILEFCQRRVVSTAGPTHVRGGRKYHHARRPPTKNGIPPRPASKPAARFISERHKTGERSGMKPKLTLSSSAERRVHPKDRWPLLVSIRRPARSQYPEVLLFLYPYFQNE